MKLRAGPLSEYLGSDEVVQTTAPSVGGLAERIRREHPDDVDFVRAAYEWVRDRITHSVDAGDRRVTLTATEVLAEGTGLCFAKSHLLVALLRNQGVPAGLCYQRLADGAGHVLHGLVAVHLEGDWHRLDPRGNNDQVCAQFSLHGEQLAWRVNATLSEVDYPRVYPSPDANVVRALSVSDNALVLVRTGLPDRLADE